VKIASWNVESIRAHHDRVIDWIDANQPDVICMQETKADARRFPLRAFEARGFDIVIHGGEQGRGGVALGSPHEMSDIVLAISGAVAPLDEPRPSP